MWYASMDQIGHRASLCGADLRNVDFRSIDFLSLQQKVNRVLGELRLGGRALSGDRPTLRGVDLREVNLTGVRLDAELEGADLRGALMDGIDLHRDIVRGAFLDDAKLRGANLSGVDFGGASLKHADLRGAVLAAAHLDSANLTAANLSGTNLSEASVSSASLRGSILRGANLAHAGIGNTDLEDADLRGVVLSGASLASSDLRGADLAGAIFDLQPGALPTVLGVALAKNLSELTYRESPLSLVDLRDELRRKEFRDQEKEITFAIKRAHRIRTAQRGGVHLLEAGLTWLLFEETYQYGMSPWRPLGLLMMLVVLFGIVYAIFIGVGRKSRILVVSFPGRQEGGESVEEIPFGDRSVVSNATRLLGYGLWFSTLSALHSPWREIDVQGWVSRIQPWRTLRGQGWVRTVSGVESIISIYLLALWIIAYFRLLFE